LSKLLDQSVDKIRRLRSTAGIVPIDGRDALTYLQTVSDDAARVPREEWRHALLHAAEMLRDLHIILDTETKIRIGLSPDDEG
jgi:hypothetical protein